MPPLSKSITVDFTEKKSCGINHPPPVVLSFKNICRLRVPAFDFAERSSIIVVKNGGRCVCVPDFNPYCASAMTGKITFFGYWLHLTNDFEKYERWGLPIESVNTKFTGSVSDLVERLVLHRY
jgi:hypothetical protein